MPALLRILRIPLALGPHYKMYNATDLSVNGSLPAAVCVITQGLGSKHTSVGFTFNIGWSTAVQLQLRSKQVNQSINARPISSPRPPSCAAAAAPIRALPDATARPLPPPPLLCPLPQPPPLLRRRRGAPVRCAWGCWGERARDGGRGLLRLGL